MTLIAVTAARSLADIDADVINAFNEGMRRLSVLIPTPPPFEFTMFLQGEGEGTLYRYLTGQFDPRIDRVVHVHDKDVVSTYLRLQKMVDGCDGLIALDDSRDPGDPAQPRPKRDVPFSAVDQVEASEWRGTTSGKCLMPGASRWVRTSTQIASQFNIPSAYVQLGSSGARISDWRMRAPLWSRNVFEPTEHVVEPSAGWPDGQCPAPGCDRLEHTDPCFPRQQLSEERSKLAVACEEAADVETELSGYPEEDLWGQFYGEGAMV